MKIFCLCIILGAIMFMPSCKNLNYNTIQEAIINCNKIEIVVNNENIFYDKNNAEFDNVLNIFDKMLENSHQMPAFGVSLNDETIQAKQTGVWIELYYGTTCFNNEMPFDSLLIQVEPENTGFNVIRKYDDKYDGRCFYIDLVDTNMSELYNTLKD